MGLEIAEQVGDIDAVVIPVGGAGLLAGAAVALKALCPNVQIIVSLINFFRYTTVLHLNSIFAAIFYRRAKLFCHGNQRLH